MHPENNDFPLHIHPLLEHRSSNKTLQTYNHTPHYAPQDERYFLFPLTFIGFSTFGLDMSIAVAAPTEFRKSKSKASKWF